MHSASLPSSRSMPFSVAYLTVSLGIALETGFIPASEADEHMLTESDWRTEIPKVVSATRQAQNVTRAPSSVTIIDQAMINALGAFNVAEILRLVPGFQVFYSNGATFGVTPHGFSDRDPRRMEVRVNGRSVYLPQLSSVAWETLGIAPTDIDHIEVVRGSNVPAYGSNAILGAVNIITRNAVKASGGSLSVSSGSVETRVVNARQSLSVDAMDFLLRASYKENDGFDGVEDDSSVGHLVFSGVYTPDLLNSVEFEFGYSNGQFGIGDGDHLNEFADDMRRSSWASADWERSDQEQQWKAHFSYTDYRFERDFRQLLSDILTEGTGTVISPAQIPFIVPGHEDEAIQLAWGDRYFSVFNLELEHHRRWHNDLRTVWGLGVRADRLKNEHNISRDGYVESPVYYAFGNTEWDISTQWLFNAGLMIEDKEGFDADISPRLALNLAVNPNHHLRLSLTRAFRQPALMEAERLWSIRFANGDLLDLQEESHPDIASERVDSMELGYLGFWFDHKLQLDAKVFREEIRDAIDAFDTTEDSCANAGGSGDPKTISLAAEYCLDFFVGDEYGAPLDKKLRVFSNTADWNVEGFEAQVGLKLGGRSWLRLQYAYLSADGKRDRSLVRNRQVSPLENAVPEHSAGLLANHQFLSGWKVSGFLQYTDFISWRSGTSVDGYSRLDIKLSKTWQWQTTEGELALIAQNVTDEEYLEYQNNNEFTPRGFLSFTIKWP